MAKECKVIVNNDVVTVFVYDDIEVQVPSIHDKDAKTVNVEYKNGVYKVVDEKAEAKTEVKTEAKPEVKTEYKAEAKKYTKETTYSK